MDTLTVCNMALSNIGQKKITQAQLDADIIPEAIQCNLHFAPDRDDVLAEINWAFAKVKEALVLNDVVKQDTTGSYRILDWQYYYNKPANCRKAWYVYNELTYDDKMRQDFEMLLVSDLSSYFIGSNLKDAWAEYTYQVNDPNQWDSKFIKAFSWKISSSIAKAITGDDKIALAAGQTYKMLIDEAKRINAQENKKQHERKSGYQDARA